MEIPPTLRYTTSHEWARRDGDQIVVGITAHAQEELRDVVYVELPPVGKPLKQGEPVAVVESVKAAFDIYAPVSGTIAGLNPLLDTTPHLVNQHCYGQGWLFSIRPSQPAEWDTLLTAEAYAKLIQA